MVGVSSRMNDDAILNELAQTVQDITGVQLGKKQESLVRSRVAKRMREVGVQDISEYWSFFNTHKNTELSSLISLLTTHHTFFFREYAHFELLLEELPKIVAKARSEGRKEIKIWSAACSYGHEPYSLAMFLETHLPTFAPDFSFKVVATDVCADSVDRAKKGIYRWNELQKVPKVYLSGNWLRGTGEIQDFVKASDRLKNRIEFQTLNLLEFDKSFNTKRFDFIFCRNVFIYFTPEDVKAISLKMQKLMYPGSYLVLGLSESLGGDLDKLKHSGRSSYMFDDGSLVKPSPTQPVTVTSSPVKTGPIRVLCVDDSPVVLKIMKKLLSTSHGFDVVGTAANGQEAYDFLKTHQVDIMTLDIHMPVMDGVSYLEKHFHSGHPPVVMLSSVAEEGQGPSMRALELGASDYIEKPTLENLNDKAEEIIGKLKAVSFQRREKLSSNNLEFVKSIAPQVSHQKTSSSCMVLMFDKNSLDKIDYIIRQHSSFDAPLFLVFDGLKSEYDLVLNDLKTKYKSKFDKVGHGQIQCLDSFMYSNLRVHTTYHFAAIMLLCPPRPILTLEWQKFQAKNYIVEEVNRFNDMEYERLLKLASCKVPYTSFAWEASKILREIERARAA